MIFFSRCSPSPSCLRSSVLTPPETKTKVPNPSKLSEEKTEVDLEKEMGRIEAFESSLRNLDLLPSNVRHSLIPVGDRYRRGIVFTTTSRTDDRYPDSDQNLQSYEKGKSTSSNPVRISLPKEATISVNSRDNVVCPFPQWVDSTYYTTQAPWYLQLALKMLYIQRYQSITGSTKDSGKRKGSQGKYLEMKQSYLSLLPNKVCEFTTLYHWEDHELENYLRYPPLIRKVQSQKKKWNTMIDELYAACNIEKRETEREGTKKANIEIQEGEREEREEEDVVDDEYAYEYTLERGGEIIEENEQDSFTASDRDSMSPRSMLSGDITRSCIIASMENVLSRSFQGKEDFTYGIGYGNSMIMGSLLPSITIIMTSMIAIVSLKLSPELSLKFLSFLDTLTVPWYIPILTLSIPFLILPLYREYIQDTNNNNSGIKSELNLTSTLDSNAVASTISSQMKNMNMKKNMEYIMAPLIDSFNHKTRAISKLDFSSVKQELVLNVYREEGKADNDKAQQQGNRDDELFISYGEKTNDELLQFFGFVETNNPVDSYLFENVVERLTSADIYTGASVSDSREQREERIMKLKSKGEDLFNAVNELHFKRILLPQGNNKKKGEDSKVVLLNSEKAVRGLRILFSSDEEYLQDEDLEDKIIQSPMALTVSNFEESPFDVIKDDSDTQTRVQKAIEFLIEEEMKRLASPSSSSSSSSSFDSSIVSQEEYREKQEERINESRQQLGEQFRQEKCRLLSLIKENSKTIISMSSSS